jgi:diacylglycerol O-acyltransferase
MMLTSQNLTPSVYTAFAGVATTAVAFWLYTKKRRTEEATKRWSYTSQGIAMGSFPAAANHPEPIINAVMLFKECPQVDDLVNQVVSKMLQYDRLNTVYDNATGQGRHCENLDPQELVRVIKVNAAADHDDLMAMVDQHMNHPLSEGVRGQLLPWWEFLVLQNKGEGPSAVVWRSHHALADGISMVHIVEDIMTDMEGNKITNTLPQGLQKKFKIKRTFLDMILETFKALGSFGYMMSGPFDDRTAFSHAKMVHNRKRKAVCFEPLPLHFIKELKNVAGVSLNDILYTCISQALHDYLKEQDDPVLRAKGKDLLCRTLMAIALPGPSGKDKATLLRNRWCLLSADFAVGIDDILDRLSHVHKSMTKLKQSMLPMMVIGSQNYIAPFLPLSVAQGQVLGLFSRHSVAFTNVPGPPEPCKLAGCEISGVYMVFSNLLPQISVLSYSGKIFGNITLDPEAIPNSERIPIHLSRALVLLATKLDVDAPLNIRRHAEKQ